MNCREFIASIGSVALSPLAAQAQEAGHTYRLGVPIPATRASVEPFFDELRLAGFVEGQNLVVTGRYSVRAEQIAEATAELLKAEPEVILCGPESYLHALRTATRSMPLDSMSEDLVAEGFVASLAKPGGNITGISLLSPELNGKRMEILTEAVPGPRRVAALTHSIATREHLEQQQERKRWGCRSHGSPPVSKDQDMSNQAPADVLVASDISFDIEV
jgi:putative ABC transport system substrate-binding protein